MLNRIFKSSIALALILFVLPGSASAHVANSNGFIGGATHPFLGLDHLLAMMAVGIISVQIGGKALWSVPVAFVGAMIVGGIVGIGGVHIPFIEVGIAASVIFLGIAIAAAKKLPLLGTIAATILFAIFHGHAHGTEISTAVQPALYIIGFVVSTTVLHIGGIVTGLAAKQSTKSLMLLRTSGAIMSFTGLAIILGL